MSLYALVDGQRARATPDGNRRAACADCGTSMIAKTGTTVIHHWAHEAEQPGCEASCESPWHLGWKDLAADGTQEIAVGNRRADVLAPGGFAVEFQKSPMTPEEVRARETDWKRRLVWVFDAQDAYAEGRLVIRRHPDREPATPTATSPGRTPRSGSRQPPAGRCSTSTASSCCTSGSGSTVPRCAATAGR